MNNKPIGIFDSGIGGLTVLQKLTALLPQENFCYLADLQFFPYGQKSWDILHCRLLKIVDFFAKQDVKMLVIACNTASLHAKDLQSNHNFPIIDVIQPTCQRTKKVTLNNKVCLLATNATVDSGVYQRNLQNMGIYCCAIACPEFVTVAENGNLQGSFDIVKNKLQQAKSFGCDTVIHGCTHFEVLQNVMSKVLPMVKFVNCGEPTSVAVKEYLQSNDLQTASCQKGKVSIFATAKGKHLQERLPCFAFGDCLVTEVSI